MPCHCRRHFHISLILIFRHLYMLIFATLSMPFRHHAIAAAMIIAMRRHYYFVEPYIRCRQLIARCRLFSPITYYRHYFAISSPLPPLR
jgi:hypothetical protein